MFYYQSQFWVIFFFFFGVYYNFFLLLTHSIWNLWPGNWLLITKFWLMYCSPCVFRRRHGWQLSGPREPRPEKSAWRSWSDRKRLAGFYFLRNNDYNCGDQLLIRKRRAHNFTWKQFILQACENSLMQGGKTDFFRYVLKPRK